MKTDKTPFEESYYDEVFNSTFEMETSFLDDLEARLNKEDRKKKRVIFWWFFGFLTAIGVFFALFLNHDNNSVSSNEYSKNLKAITKYGSSVVQPEKRIKNLNNFTNKSKTKTIHPIKNQNVKCQAEKLWNTVISLGEKIPDSLEKQIEKQISGTSSNDFLAIESYEILKSDTIPQVTDSINISNDMAKKPDSTLFQNENNNLTSFNRFELQLFGGINFSRSFLAGNYSWINSYDLNLIHSERTLVTPIVGMNMFLNSQNVQFGIGVGMTKIGEQSSYSYIDQVLVQNPVNPSIYDTTYTTKTYVGTNSYSFLQLPLSIGYRFDFNRFTIVPRYAYSIGIKSNSNKGYYPDRNGVGLFEVSAPKVIYQHNVNIDFRLNFNNYYFSLIPFFTINSNKGYPMILSNRKYLNYGINMGVGVKF
jgi:hypothetical protein